MGVNTDYLMRTYNGFKRYQSTSFQDMCGSSLNFLTDAILKSAKMSKKHITGKNLLFSRALSLTF
jgi:hypothetical protein